MKPFTFAAHRARGWHPRAVVGMALFVAFVAPPIAHAAVAGGSAASGQPSALRDAVITTLVGDRVAPGVCGYTSTLQLAPGQPAIEEDSLAIDDSTCTMTVQRGVPVDANPDASAPPNQSEQSGGAPATGSSSAAPAAAAAASVHSAGYYKSYYEDPVGIDVNSVRNNVDWYWNGSHVSGGYCSYHYGWYSASGWGLHENNFFCRYENNQTQVRSSSYAHFKNGIFCAFIDTHTYYDRNNAYGKANGYLVGTVNAYKKGGCTGLLSFHTQLKRTLN